MQRYTLTEYADASSETRAVFDDFMRTTGATAVPVWLKSLGHSAPLTRAYWERAKGTLFAGNLPLPLKEMIVFVVSARNGARYCSACHAQNVLSLDKTLAFDDLRDLVSADKGFKLSCINCITDRTAQDKYNGSSTVRGYPVKVYKATPENSPFGNPIPCGNDGTEIIHDSSDPRLKLWAIGAEGIHPDKFDA